MNAIVNPSILTAASRQWASRPADERFTSLTDMQSHFHDVRARSRASVRTTRRVRAIPMMEDQTHRSLLVEVIDKDTRKVEVAAPTHWSFGQLAERAGAPASYLRKLPSELSADCVNYGLLSRDIEEVGVLVRDEPGQGEVVTLAAATGPNYGRIWNAEILDALTDKFGDGVNGNFRVPGEFGKRVDVTKDNTTLYASDRDMFVFLADEEHRIEVPNRRHGQSGSMARGFFIWNSEVGSQTFGIATFLFDYVCMNRIVWGAAEYKEVRIRHTAGAPDRYIEEVAPALIQYANSSTASIDQAIARAREIQLEDRVDDFLATRFSRGQVTAMKLAHQAEEDRPIETIWDAVVGATAYAKSIANQDQRVVIERAAGTMMDKLV